MYVGAPLLLLIGAACVPPPGPGAAHLLGIPDLCPFHRITGRACPACGMTRALVCIIHGHLADSIGYHPLGIAVFAALVAAAVVRLAGRKACLAPRAEATVAICTAVVFFVVWIARLTNVLPSPP